MTSSRLPGKVLLPLANKPVLQHIIERLRRSKYIDDVIIACTTNEADDAIIELCEQLDCKYYRGSEDDVLTRVLEAAKAYKTDIIVEVTADCPCVDWETTDALIKSLIDSSKDYASNVIKRNYPRGLDVQVFWAHILNRVDYEVDNEVDRQHVSTWIYKNPKTIGKYKLANTGLDMDMSKYRLTLDTQADYDVLKMVFESFPDNGFTFKDLYQILYLHEELFDLNKDIPQKSYYRELVDAYDRQKV
jgi:spore coat polysaccharide biosynthesis protein SpsF